MNSSSHDRNSLFVLFQDLIAETFRRQLGMADPELTDYLAGLLAAFAHFDHVYRIRDLTGTPLEEVADMMEEADIRSPIWSFQREREIHKHIGDFTLFWTGVYPEYLRHLRQRFSRDALLDYTERGKSSYYIASTFDHGDLASEARILRCLSHTFETVALGLQGVRSAWENAAAQNSGPN